LLHDGYFLKKEVVIFKNYDKLQLLVKNLTVHSLNAPHKQGVLELNEDCAHVIVGSTEGNQGVV
jgi:hypothetical protein